MLTRQNYKELATIRFLNKSQESNSKYYQITFGKVRIKVRVSDHYSRKWKGEFQIVSYNPKNITVNDVKGRSFEALSKAYHKLLSKKKRNDSRESKNRNL